MAGSPLLRARRSGCFGIRRIDACEPLTGLWGFSVIVPCAAVSLKTAVVIRCRWGRFASGAAFSLTMFSRFDRSRYSQQLWNPDCPSPNIQNGLPSSGTLSAAMRIMSEPRLCARSWKLSCRRKFFICEERERLLVHARLDPQLSLAFAWSCCLKMEAIGLGVPGPLFPLRGTREQSPGVSGAFNFGGLSQPRRYLTHAGAARTYPFGRLPCAFSTACDKY